MNTKLIRVLLVAVSTGALVGFASTNLTGDYVVGAVASIGYLTFAALVAMASIGSRRSERTYTA